MNPEYASAAERMASAEFQERQARDIALVNRVQAGFTREEPSEENPRPLVTDGELSEDAAQALGELFVHYEPLIKKAAHQTYARLHRPPGFSVDDLVQEGFYGLFRASLNWNAEKARGGFLSYARRSVTRHVLRVAEDTSTTIRLSAPQRKNVNRYRGSYWKRYSEGEHSPRREQIARFLGTYVAHVDDWATLEAMTRQMGSIDGGYFEDDREQHTTYGRGQGRWKPIDPSASEAREVEEEALVSEIKSIVNQALDGSKEGGLSDREAEVLRMRFFGKDGTPMSLEEVSKEFGVTRERVRQIEARALAVLRHPNYESKLRDLLSAA